MVGSFLIKKNTANNTPLSFVEEPKDYQRKVSLSKFKKSYTFECGWSWPKIIIGKTQKPYFYNNVASGLCVKASEYFRQKVIRIGRQVYFTSYNFFFLL